MRSTCTANVSNMAATSLARALVRRRPRRVVLHVQGAHARHLQQHPSCDTLQITASDSMPALRTARRTYTRVNLPGTDGRSNESPRPVEAHDALTSMSHADASGVAANIAVHAARSEYCRRALTTAPTTCWECTFHVASVSERAFVTSSVPIGQSARYPGAPLCLRNPPKTATTTSPRTNATSSTSLHASNT